MHKYNIHGAFTESVFTIHTYIHTHINTQKYKHKPG